MNESASSRVVLGAFLANSGASKIEQDIIFTILGNNTLNLHFNTGMRVPTQFRVGNMTNSNAPFIEVTVTGFLIPR